MSNLYDRYKVRFRHSKDSLSRATYDDAELDSSAFDAQQSMEFLIKYILDNKNISYKKTHDINYLLSLLDDFSFELKDKALSMAKDITTWEESSRYGSGVATTINLIRECHRIIESIDSAWIKLNKPDDEDSTKKSSVNDLLSKAEGNK